MKKKIKTICIVAISLIIIAVYNFYQQSKINNFKQELRYVVSKNIQHFAGFGGQTDNTSIYAEEYASIVAAQEVYSSLCRIDSQSGISSNEWEYNLNGLLCEIKNLMSNDKEKFKKAFQEQDISKLMFKISDNLKDRESINKVYKVFKYYRNN